MRNLTDQKLKREFQSPRKHRSLGLLALAIPIIGVAVLVVARFDPFHWLSEDAAVREAQSEVGYGISFITVVWFGGVWLMILRPLQTGVVMRRRGRFGWDEILRWKDPAAFRSQIKWNCVLPAALLVVCVHLLVNAIRNLQKAQARTGARKHEATQTVCLPQAADSRLTKCRMEAR